MEGVERRGVTQRGTRGTGPCTSRTVTRTLGTTHSCTRRTWGDTEGTGSLFSTRPDPPVLTPGDLGLSVGSGTPVRNLGDRGLLAGGPETPVPPNEEVSAGGLPRERT